MCDVLFVLVRRAITCDVHFILVCRAVTFDLLFVRTRLTVMLFYVLLDLLTAEI